MDETKPGILDKVGRNDGMTVPEGYFETFADRMAASLPERPELECPSKIIAPPRTLWHQVRPYVYLAAMFAGVWCMLKMFTLMSSPTTTDIDSNPVLAEAFTNDTFVDQYIYTDVNQWDLYDDLLEDGFDVNDVDLDLWDDNDSDGDASTAILP